VRRSGRTTPLRSCLSLTVLRLAAAGVLLDDDASATDAVDLPADKESMGGGGGKISDQLGMARPERFDEEERPLRPAADEGLAARPLAESPPLLEVVLCDKKSFVATCCCCCCLALMSCCGRDMKAWPFCKERKIFA